MAGYVKIWRKLREHELWKERRVFSRAEAWIDLIMRANWQDTVLIDGTTLERGCLATSIRDLAFDWSWSRSRVDRFLISLDGTQIEHRAGHRCSTIRILKYEEYQDVREPGGTQARRKRDTKRDTNEATIKELIINNKTSPNGEGARARGPEPEKKNYAPGISMSDAELKTLTDEFGAESVKFHVKVCSDWLTANGKTKKSAAAFIRNWIRKEKVERRGYYSTANQTQNPAPQNHQARILFKDQRDH